MVYKRRMSEKISGDPFCQKWIEVECVDIEIVQTFLNFAKIQNNRNQNYLYLSPPLK